VVPYILEDCIVVAVVIIIIIDKQPRKKWLDPEDEGTVIKASENTHPAMRCHIPEDLNL
jgi:hypothetical protein